MKKRKVFVLLVICLMTVALFTACGNDDGAELSAVEIIAKSAEAMDEVGSFASTMETVMEMTVEGEFIIINMSSDIVMNVDPLQMSMRSTMLIPGFEEPMDMDMYMFHEGDDLVTYMYVMGQWMTQTTPFSEELWNELAQTQSVQQIYELLTSAEILGEETVNGVRSWKIEVTMSGDAMYELMVEMIEDMAGMFDADMFAEMGDMTYTLWVAQDTFYQVRMVMDMTDMMAQMMEELGAEFSKMLITMDSFDFGTAPEITLPAGAANAIETILF